MAASETAEETAWGRRISRPMGAVVRGAVALGPRCRSGNPPLADKRSREDDGRERGDGSNAAGSVAVVSLLKFTHDLSEFAAPVRDLSPMDLEQSHERFCSKAQRRVEFWVADAHQPTLASHAPREHRHGRSFRVPLDGTVGGARKIPKRNQRPFLTAPHFAAVAFARFRATQHAPTRAAQRKNRGATSRRLTREAMRYAEDAGSLFRTARPQPSPVTAASRVGRSTFRPASQTDAALRRKFH